LRSTGESLQILVGQPQRQFVAVDPPREQAAAVIPRPFLA